MPVPSDFQEQLLSVERLLGKIESVADPNLRSNVQELVQLVMDLHGAGLDRLLELIRASPDGGEGIILKAGRDELVASLLVLHGIHPLDIEARVVRALDNVRPRLRAHEGEVELLSVQDGAVRLQLRANGRGCGSTAQALKEMIEEAVYEAAPDITSLAVAGAEDRQGFVPLEMLQGTAPAPQLAFASSEKGLV